MHQYEVGPDGCLQPAGYFRFLQEAATVASTAAGFDPGWYARTGTLWLVRRATVEMLGPARAGETVEVTTWVADVRRVRSVRRSVLHRGEELLARAETDWVFVDSATRRPQRVPAALAEALAPENAPLPRPHPLHRESPKTAVSSTALRRVQLHELDGLDHVNNAQYVNYIEQSFLDALTELGWSRARGTLRPYRYDIEYLGEAFYGEYLRCHTALSVAGPRTLGRMHRIEKAADRSAVLEAQAHERWDDGEGNALPHDLAAALVRV